MVRAAEQELAALEAAAVAKLELWEAAPRTRHEASWTPSSAGDNGASAAMAAATVFPGAPYVAARGPLILVPAASFPVGSATLSAAKVRRRENMVGVNMILAEYHQIQAWLL